MNFLVDENMPRSLSPQIAALGFTVEDVRDIRLGGKPDSDVDDKQRISLLILCAWSNNIFFTTEAQKNRG